MDMTIKDVAKIAGVSPATVSRVINGTKPVSEEVTKRVLDAIEKTGFKRNAAARSLVVKRSNLLGVIIPDISNMYFSELIKGIDSMAHFYNYNIILSSSSTNENREVECFNLLLEKGVDGIIFTAYRYVRDPIYKIIDRASIPFVSLNRKCRNTISIRVDNTKESYEATKYLIKLGHRNIAFISGYFDDDASGIQRMDGYKKALKEYGIPIRQNLICEGDFTFKGGYNGAEKLLMFNKDITAIFAVNDEMAYGVMAYIQDIGLKIPKDISVMGFDDVAYSQNFRPRLTTVHQPIYDIGEMASKTIIKAINEGFREDDIIVKGGIAVRESTRKIE